MDSVLRRLMMTMTDKSGLTGAGWTHISISNHDIGIIKEHAVTESIHYKAVTNTAIPPTVAKDKFVKIKHSESQDALCQWCGNAHLHNSFIYNYYPLLRVRSWNNGVRCMSFYILITSMRGYIAKSSLITDDLYIWELLNNDNEHVKERTNWFHSYVILDSHNTRPTIRSFAWLRVVVCLLWTHGIRLKLLCRTAYSNVLPWSATCWKPGAFKKSISYFNESRKMAIVWYLPNDT